MPNPLFVYGTQAAPQDEGKDVRVARGVAEMPNPLFVYGTLRDPDVLALVLGRRLGQEAVRAACAPDHRALVFPGRTYPALCREAGASAEGMLLDGLTGTDLALLDLFEGEEYSRGPIEIIVSGRGLAADVYWPVSAIPADAENWMFAGWVSRHKAAFLAVQESTIAQFRRRLSSR